MTEKISPEISSKVIRALGGTSRVAKFCKVKAPSVSEWKTGGMPLYRYEYLRLRFAKTLAEFPKN